MVGTEVSIPRPALRDGLEPVTPTRPLNSNFQPFPSGRPGWVSYTVELTISLNVLNEDITVELRSDENSPPTTPRASVRYAGTPDITLSSSVRMPLTYLVPEGHWVRLHTIVGAGTPGAAVVHQVETEL